ncbi:MAG: hypothetical protein ACK4K2_04870 [Dehalococcoidia bacterium]
MAESLSSWIERVRRLVAYQQEAVGFLERVRQQFPLAMPQHAPAVARLWLLADEVDPFLCTLLEELNRGLLEGKGQVDTTRGAQVRQEGMPLGPGLEGVPGLSPQLLEGKETMRYDCTWSLRWEPAKTVAVQLSVEPDSEVFRGVAMAHQAGLTRDVVCPIRSGERQRFEEGVRDALLECFASEMVCAPGTSPPSPQPDVKASPTRRRSHKRGSK